jgi:hypothetical protein
MAIVRYCDVGTLHTFPFYMLAQYEEYLPHTSNLSYTRIEQLPSIRILKTYPPTFYPQNLRTLQY